MSPLGNRAGRKICVMCTARGLTVLAASAATVAALAACGTQSDSSAEPVSTSQQQWTCPPAPTSSAWTDSARKPPSELVPGSPVSADACTYRIVGQQQPTLEGRATHYSDGSLTALVKALATAPRVIGEPSCPAPGPNTIATVTTIRFTYADAEPVVVTTSKECPGVASNGAVRVRTGPADRLAAARYGPIVLSHVPVTAGPALQPNSAA